MEFNANRSDNIFTRKVEGGRKRTYFVDVKKTKGDDHYMVITESVKRQDGQGTERHKIFVYKEDLLRLLTAINEAGDKLKEMMPDYDFNTFERKYKEFDPGQDKDEGMTW
ncbi:MAG: DUF3276 family protein [Saprospiraceae bacterium]|nr:DUF3276 family protein [Saprospiraceae bacterium]